MTLPAKTSSDRKLSSAVIHSVALALSSLLAYWIVTRVFSGFHFVSHADDLLGGIGAVVATLFVYRCSYSQSLSAAIHRMSATPVSFVLCFVYFLLTSSHPWGLALLIGIGTLVMMMIGQPDDVVTTSITTAVVMVVAALSPQSPSTDIAPARYRDRCGDRSFGGVARPPSRPRLRGRRDSTTESTR